MNTIHYNYIEIIGHMNSPLIVSHVAKNGEPIFNGTFAVKRLSGTVDYITVAIPEHVLDRDNKGKKVILGEHTLCLTGEIRSYDRPADGEHHLAVMLYVQTFAYAPDKNDCNNARLVGSICRPTSYRRTPFGREICDFMIAIKRGHRKRSYIPCVAWGVNARRASMWQVGDVVDISGRLQSRNYDKMMEDGHIETLTAYEVSIASITKEGVCENGE